MDEKILDIIENYERKEQILMACLGKKEKHPTINGSYRESEWESFFREIVPEKFSIKKNVFIIDAYRKISDEVDLAIFDEQYTPYIFKDREYQYIPIEAVAAVVQCKSTSIQGVDKWIESINQLRTSDGAIARIHGLISTGIDKSGREQTQVSTRPIKILCHTSDRKSAVDTFDLTIKAYDNKLTVFEAREFKNLSDWYETLNHYKVSERDELKGVKIYENSALEKFSLKDYEVGKGEQEITIISLTFKLNQLLMLINNPLFFPHKAYVDMFNKILNPKEGDKGE